MRLYSIGDVRAAISKTWEGEQADLHQILVDVREYLEALPQESAPYVYHFCAHDKHSTYDGTISRSEPLRADEDYHSVKRSIAKYFGLESEPSMLCITSLSLVSQP